MFKFASSDANTYTLDGGLGSDTLNYSAALGASALIVNLSSAGAGNVSGASYGTSNFTNIEKFITGAGDDTFTYSAGDTTAYNIIGGTGNDKLNYAAAGNSAALTVNFSAAGSGTVAGTGYGNDSLIGGAGNDNLIGGSGNDSLDGGLGDDTLDLRTNNSSLAGDSASGGAGNDTVTISQDALGSSTINLDGGSGTDSLVVYKGTATATLDLLSLKAKNFETLDFSSDSSANSVVLSSAGIQQLVNNSTSSVLNLKLGSNDSYTIAGESGVTVSQGKNITFYSDAAMTHQIAQVTFTYV